MKNLVIFLFAFNVYSSGKLQAQYCATDHLHEQLMRTSDIYKKNYLLYNEKVYQEITRNKISSRHRMSYTLPVVVHVISPVGTAIGQANNISDAEIEKGLDLLNQAFANQGAFNAPNGQDIGIQFCLAKRDPNGNATTGITRHGSNVVNESMCSPGTDVNKDIELKKIVNWNCAEYINVWLVTDLFGLGFGCNLAGYAYYPGNTCNYDGIVQESRYWNSVSGTRITAHEVGHYLGLAHTFNGGCDNADCLRDGDQVCDTPSDDSPSFSPCNTNSCNTDNPDLPDDNTNYMDYTSCGPLHFTAGQKQRMIVSLEQLRTSLITSSACTPVVANDISILECNSLCESKICPIIVVKNNGSNAITSLTINYRINGGAILNFTYTGTIAKNEVKNIPLPCELSQNQSNTVDIEIVLVNGAADGNASNNKIIKPFVLKPLTANFDVTTNTLTANFTNRSTFAKTYLWEFGDGNTSTVQSPTYTYNSAGNYTVKLTAYTDCDTVSISKTIFISGICKGPVLNLPFNGNMNDVSGNNNHGIPGNSPTLTTDRFGNPNSAYLFGGFNDQDWIRVLNNPTLKFDKQMTLSIWFKQCSFEGMDGNGRLSSNGFHILFSKAGDGIAAFPGFYSGTYTDVSNKMYVNYNNVRGADMAIDTTFTCFDKCEWIHYVVVIDFNILKIYFNGNLQKVRFSNNINFNDANNQDFYIGRMGGGGIIWYPYNGIIDDVQLYNCALNDDDIKQLFDNYKDPLQDNYTIQLDNIKSNLNYCDTTSSNQLIVEADPKDGPYEYSIDNKVWQKSNQFIGLGQGKYRIFIRNKCAIKDTFVDISIPKFLADSSLYLEPVTCKSLGRIGIQGLYGQAPYKYKINSNNFQSTGLFDNLMSGTYRITIQDANGCEINRDFTVEDFNKKLSLKIDSAKLVKTCSDSSIFIKVSATGTNPYYYYYLNNGLSNSNGNFSNLQVGNYTVFSRDENKCISDTLIFEIKDARRKPVTNLKYEICEGDTLTQFGKSYFNTGIYYDTLSTLDNCDSIVVSELKVNTRSRLNIDREICLGDFFEVGNKKYFSSGMYQDTLINANGCDSIISTSLIVRATHSNSLMKEICQGSTFRVGTQVYFQSGSYVDTLRNIFNCDSIVNLNLVVHPIISRTDEVSICQGDSYRINNHNYSSSGIYRDTLQTIFGCDSLVITNLMVNPNSILQLQQSICKGDYYDFGNRRLVSEGTFVDTLSSIHRCDSIVALNLSTKDHTFNSLNYSICEGDIISVGNNVYDSDGTYRDTLNSINGCDSILTTTLKVNPIQNINLDSVYCKDQYIKFIDRNITEDEIISIKLSNQFGCDSIVTLDAKVRPCNHIFVPNIFSPNGDNVNDYFEAKGIDVGSFTMQIFNRWGELIYTSHDINQGWDGKFKDREVNPGVYVYLIKGRYINGDTFSLHGDLTLLR
jgi:gliding motility-associated-like protein